MTLLKKTGLALVTGTLLLATHAHAKTVCVFSLVGAQGDLWAMMTDYRIAAASEGEQLDLRVFTDERVAAEDLKAGLCDGLLMTGIKARQFVPFSGSIDSIGGLHSYDALRAVIALTSHPQLSEQMQSGVYAIAGILPLGAAYLFMKDRTLTSVDKIAGKRMAVFDNDRAQILMCERLGIKPELSDVTNFSTKFNNNMVDLIAAPATAYMPLELYRGVGAHGMVVKLPSAQLTLQLVVRQEKFSESFLHWSRDYFSGQFDRAMQVITAAESEILFFYPPPDADRPQYQEMMNDARLALIEEGVYDTQMMAWLKKARCKVSPMRPECSNGGRTDDNITTRHACPACGACHTARGRHAAANTAAV